MSTRTVLKAAAGTGKTEELVKRWLGLVQKGHDPQRIVAITFTRKAAAEFASRVAGVLLAHREDVSDAERSAFERVSREDAGRFTAHMPNTEAVRTSALKSLGSAPMGTIDSFVQSLLAESALDARVPGTATATPLDLPSGGTFRDYLTQAAREMVRTNREAATLLGDYGIGEAITLLARPVYPAALQPATTDEVLAELNRGLFVDEAATTEEVHGWLRDQNKLNRPSAAQISTALEKKNGPVGASLPVGVALPELVRALAEWLCDPTSPAPEWMEGRPKFAIGDLGKYFDSLAGGNPVEAIRADGAAAALDALGFAGSGGSRRDSVRKYFTGAGKAFADAIYEWLEGPNNEVPPQGLALALGGLSTGTKKDPTAGLPTLGRAPVPALPLTTPDVEPPGPPDAGYMLQIGPNRLKIPLDALAKLPEAMLRPTARAKADKLRLLIDKLRREVTQSALAAAAAGGAVDYDIRLRVLTNVLDSTAAAQSGPLWKRFTALLVDEVQDSSPEQVAFYRALERTHPDMVSIYVGDSRQSIYRFRGADPTGIDGLAAGEGGKPALGDPMYENHRSAKTLAASHGLLFGDELRQELALTGLGELESLPAPTLSTAWSDADAPVYLSLDDGRDPDAPKLDDRVLRAFHARMWKLPVSERPITVAILCPSWNKATHARDVWNRLDAEASRRLAETPSEAALSGLPMPAFLDGGGRWLDSRPVRDLRILLAALQDRSDELAWLGVWKLPMVGLSDRALYAVRHPPAGGQIKEGWKARLGWLCDLESLPATHDSEDRAAFARAAPHLRRACGHVGGRPTADVIESLASALGWRELLDVSPEPDDAAILELAIDWLRGMDEQGLTASDAFSALSAESSNRDSGQAPRLELQRPARHVSCTTIFQAKGLGYDHVCVISPGVAPQVPGSKDPRPDATSLVCAGQERRLTALKFDPAGGLDAGPDLVHALASKIEARRTREEEIRLAYVAVTRAKLTVQLGVSLKGDGVQPLLYAAWTKLKGPGVIQSPLLPDPAPPAPVTPKYVEATAPWSAPSTLPLVTERNASGLSAALGTRRDDLVATVAAVAEYEPGWSARVDYPTGGEFENVRPNDWGSVAHAWMANWRFGSVPELPVVQAWLLSEWQEDRVEVADWILALTIALSQSTSPLALLCKRPDVNLYFEHPVLGVLSNPGGAGLLTGRADLLVYDTTDRTWTVIDFKNSKKPPTKQEEILPLAGLKTYGPQLEAYAAVIRRAAPEGDSVGRVALWYLTTGGAVAWVPTQLDW